MLEKIREIHRNSNAVYGSPNITKELCSLGTAVSKGMVSRLMKKNGIRSKIVKKYRVTTDSNHNLPVAENILNRNFKASRRNEKWVSDITYIATGEGWLYLAGILDLYDGSIVGWSMGSRITKALVIDVLHEACRRRSPAPGLLLHSDRGSQYCSEAYQAELVQRHIICSMSRRGNCWDNAPMESFWGKLKTEWLNDKPYHTRSEARQAVFEYIELFYNIRRLRSVNGYVPPLKMPDVA